MGSEMCIRDRVDDEEDFISIDSMEEKEARMIVPRPEDGAKSLQLAYDGMWTAIDDVKGGPLEAHAVMKARDEEMGFIAAREVYKPSSEAECWAATGRKPIAVGWIDTNKGDLESPNYRSRLVAKEIKAVKRAGQSLFAGTPPIEALRILLGWP